MSYSKHKIFSTGKTLRSSKRALDAVDKIQELMATGEYRDPIAERAAQESQAPSEVRFSFEQDGASSEEDIAFDDL